MYGSYIGEIAGPDGDKGTLLIGGFTTSGGESRTVAFIVITHSNGWGNVVGLKNIKFEIGDDGEIDQKKSTGFRLRDVEFVNQQIKGKLVGDVDASGDGKWVADFTLSSEVQPGRQGFLRNAKVAWVVGKGVLKDASIADGDSIFNSVSVSDSSMIEYLGTAGILLPPE